VLGVGLGLGLTVESVGVSSLNSIVCLSKSKGNERLKCQEMFAEFIIIFQIQRPTEILRVIIISLINEWAHYTYLKLQQHRLNR